MSAPGSWRAAFVALVGRPSGAIGLALVAVHVVVALIAPWIVR